MVGTSLFPSSAGTLELNARKGSSVSGAEPRVWCQETRPHPVPLRTPERVGIDAVEGGGHHGYRGIATEMLPSHTRLPATSLPPIRAALSHPTARQEGVCGARGGTVHVSIGARGRSGMASSLPGCSQQQPRAPTQRSGSRSVPGHRVATGRCRGGAVLPGAGAPPANNSRCSGSGKPLLLALRRPSVPPSPITSSPLSPCAEPSPAPR